MKLIDYSHTIYSQYGEDGIVDVILEKLPNRDGWCVEFGAWDGIYLSNTRALIENKGYNAVLIEADAVSFSKLKVNCAQFAGVIAIQAFVGFSQEDGLDSILAQTPCPIGFDFLSIDVDGNDIHIWRAITTYRPKLVCIEFNPTVPTGVFFEQRPDPRVNQGCSLSSIVQLGKEKGYELVCVNHANAFFVTQELFSLFEIADNSAAALRPCDAARVMVFYGFDGTLLFSDKFWLHWHGLEVPPTEIQLLPKMLRKYPLSYSRMERFLFKSFRNFLKVKARLKNMRSNLVE
jgi:hypothetical protein